MNPDGFILSGALRLSKSDSIGIPLFIDGNAWYVPEMDGDFNLLRFLDFFNQGDYEVVRDVPQAYVNRVFRVGEPAPIFFWFRGRPRVVEGDAEPRVLEEMFGLDARTSRMLSDLGGMLRDARTGVFVEKQKQWVARDIAASFDDVFLEEPSRTKYWVSRYRIALEEARKITVPPHPIDVRLRMASTKWFSRFATKADFTMISAVLGEASQGIYSLHQIREIMFSYLSHKMVVGTQSELLRIARDETIGSLFHKGVYRFYLEHGWPHVPFSYEQPDFIIITKEQLIAGHKRRAWSHALLMSEILFGDEDAPPEVEDAAMLYLRIVLGDYKTMLKEVDDSIDRYGVTRPRAFYDSRIAMLNEYHTQLNELSCIINGVDRASGQMLDGRYGVSIQMAEDLLVNARIRAR